jgi:hypothetical protein
MRSLFAAAALIAAVACGEPFTATTSGGAGGAAGGGGAAAGGTGPDSTTTSSAGGGGAGGGGTTTPLTNFGYRAAIDVFAEEAVSQGYSISLDVDHASLVATGKARADGADLYVVWDDGSTLMAIDRVLDAAASFGSASTRIWFALQSDAAAGDVAGYYLYFGEPQAVPPPADPNAVFLYWDDFDAEDSDWKMSKVGTADGNAAVANGKLRLTGNSGDLWNGADDFLYYHRPAPGDFRATVKVVGVDDNGGGLATWSHVGGVMVRGSAGAGSRYRHIGPVFSAVARSTQWRFVHHRRLVARWPQLHRTRGRAGLQRRLPRSQAGRHPAVDRLRHGRKRGDRLVQDATLRVAGARGAARQRTAAVSRQRSTNVRRHPTMWACAWLFDGPGGC